MLYWSESMKVILYGIGKRYYNLFSLEEQVDVGLIKNEAEIIGFTDGDSSKWGMPVIYDGQNYAIRNVEDFCAEDFDKIVITTKQKYEEIRCELIQKGYKEEKILLIDEIFETNPEKISYVNALFFDKQWKKFCSIDGIKIFFQENNYQEIAIYGTGIISDRLIEVLKKSADINIKYLISSDETSKVNNDLMNYKLDAELPSADLIIVAVLENYMEIERTICEKAMIEVISIQELVYKALRDARGLKRYA